MDGGLLRRAARAHAQGHAARRHVGRVDGGGDAGARRRRFPADSRARCSRGWSTAVGRHRWRRRRERSSAPSGTCSIGWRGSARWRSRVEPPDTEADALTERVASLAGDPPTLLERDGLFRRAPKQRRLYEALEQLGGSALGAPRGRAARLQPTRAPGAGAARAGPHRRGRAGARSVRRLSGVAAARRRSPPTRQAALAAIAVAGAGRRRGALRRHRQRQDAGLPRGRAPGAGRRTRRHRAGARDRPHAADGEPLPRGVRRPGGRAPQRPVRRRAGRRLAAAPPRRAAGGGRGPLRHLRAGARTSA